MKTAGETRLFFDEFEIDARRRVLLRDGQPVALKPKAFDLLVALVERRGAVVSKDELLDAVWENSFVEEKNLTVHIAALRKALGEGKNEHRFIATVPGTGYKFVAPLHEFDSDLIIETERIERIVVEERVDDKKSGEDSKHSGRSRQKIIILSALFILLLFSFGYVWQKNGRSASVPVSVRRLTTNGQVQLAALSPDGKLYAYVKNDAEKSSLRLGYVAGGNEIELRAADETDYHQLAFGPDGGRLYFSTSDEKHPQPALYRMPAFGGAVEKLADGIRDFHLSPDGERIAYARVTDDGSDSLFVARTNGADERTVFSVPRSKSFIDQAISWSPDGKRLAFGCERETEALFYDLCIKELDGEKLQRLPLGNYRYINASAWLKNGSGLVATAIPANSFSSVINYQIVSISLPDGNFREITNDLSTYNSFVSVSDDSRSLLTVEHRQTNNLWIAPTEDLAQARQITFGSFGKCDGLWGLDFSPDGRLIYTNSDMDAQIISAMNADGSGQKNLTASGYVDSALTVSADGRYIVFHSNRGGKGMDIWRMDADGGNLKRLTFDEHSYQPSVSADSQYVYYKDWIKDVGELRRVPIDGGESEILTDKETSYTTFSPDGRFFAAAYRTDKRRLAIFSAATNQLIRQFDVPKTTAFDMRPRWTPDNSAVVYRDYIYGYWSQPVAGGEPAKLAGLPKEELFTYAFSKDGRQFAFVRGQTTRDLILISNFR
ncbi:MAG: PD40 domain-containing protein [Acidobacteria bacterium]|nr:PD40 domain-containing protein [Acidobacteriota bacterium]